MLGKETIMDGSGDIFEFKLGNFICIAVRDSVFIEEPNMLFPHIPPEEIRQVCNQYEKKFENKFEMTCLIVNTGKNIILIDTGWGSERDPNAGKLLEKLKIIGISCSEIDTVINTHGHPDHIGGNAFADRRPVFPNARYVMCKDEWEFWTSGPDLVHVEEKIKKDMTEFVERHLIGIRDYFDIVDNEAEILPGIKCINTPGHTPGHTSLAISSGDSLVVYAGDVIHHPLQLLKPYWGMRMDAEVEQGKDSRIRIIKQASRGNTMLFACHFPFPGIGYVIKHKDAWLWDPVKE